MGNADDEPEWVDENQQLRREMGLAEYVPPRFEDDVFTHQIVSDIEREFDCSVSFFAFNPTYPDDWTVAVDGDEMFSIGRYRDTDGNTVYTMNSDEFRRQLESELS